MPSKLVTNYDSMFSDLPNYPRQREVRYESKTGNGYHVDVGAFVATGSDVIGKDRSKYFKRPILPNTMPMPFIRYAKEIRSEADTHIPTYSIIRWHILLYSDPLIGMCWHILLYIDPPFYYMLTHSNYTEPFYYMWTHSAICNTLCCSFTMPRR